jgi:Na+-driven multidrug efflux pump
MRNFFIAIIASLLIVISLPLLFNILNSIFITSNETKILIKDYVTIRVFSAPAEFSIYILVGFFLGIQKTFISSALIIINSTLNILLSIYFVTKLDLDVKGVALGTLLSMYITAILFSVFTYYFFIKKFKIIPRLNIHAILKIKKIITLFNINFNIFLRTILLTFSFFWITYLSSTLGEQYVAVNSILLQLVIISAFFLDAYAFSTEGIVGYSIGRRSVKMFLKVVKNSITLSFITGIILSFVLFLTAIEIINLITDIEFLRFLAYKYLLWVIVIPPIASFCYH